MMEYISRNVTMAMIIAIVLLSLISKVNAEPQLLLGEDGAYIWSTAGVSFHGSFPIDGGNSILQTWSSRRATDAARHIYLQIVGQDGELVHDPPLQLSQEGTESSLGSATTDRDDNIYVTWFSIEPDNPQIGILFAQKFNSAGAPLWGELSRRIREINGGFRMTYPPRLLPDEHGGLYHLSWARFIAIDQNGEFREDWQWINQRPDPDFGMMNYVGGTWMMIADEIGGFWYELFDEGIDIIWNHLNYNGEKLWDRPQDFIGEELHERDDWEGADVLAGYNGGCIGKINWPYYYLYVINDNGELMGDDYLFELRDGHGNHISIGRSISRLRDGTFVLNWTSGLGQSYAGVTLYDPAENRFPWGQAGIELQNRPPEVSVGMPNLATETSGGDILCTVSNPVSNGDGNPDDDIHRISREGRLVWNEPLRLVKNDPQYIVPTPDDGFWILGFSNPRVNANTLIQLNRYNEDGEPMQEEYIDIGAPRRHNPYSSLMWVDLDSSYRLLFVQEEIGLKLQTVSRGGEIIGDLSGQLLVSSDKHMGYPNPRGLTIGDRNVYMCLWRINEDADEPYLINLWGLNRNGEIDWNVTIEDSTWGDRVITHNIIAAPDGQHFLFGGAFQNRDNYIVSYHLFWLDVENGEILWRRDMPEIYQRGFPTGYDRVFVSENALYRVLVSSDDTLRIHKFDHEGNILWEAPYLGYIDRNTALSGVSLRAEGGLWLAKYGLTMDGLEVWVEALDDDGNEIIGRHFVYSEPMEYRFGSLAPTKLFDLVSDRGNLWILPIDETEFGIQCLAEDGGRLLGGHGFLPGVVDNDRDPNYFKGLSDGDGGMWLSWIEDGTMVIHFDGNAEFDEGWSENGHVLWETGVSSINSQYLLDNGDLALMVTKTRSDGPMGPLGSGSSAYYIQHVRDFNQQTVGAHPELSPFKFGITKTYPNPFNQNAIINFSLPVEQIINLNLYDLSGRLVGIIAEGRFPADSHSVVYNKNQLPSGIYIARLEGQDNTHSVKMTLLR